MRITILFLSLLSSSFSTFALQGGSENVKVSCQAIRDEPGSPTYGFDLVETSDQKFEARYLDYPGDANLPPTVSVSFSDLTCDFLSSDAIYFRCSKLGVSVESVLIEEGTKHPLEDEILRRNFKEFRALGAEVPGILLISRFGHADECNVLQDR